MIEHEMFIAVAVMAATFFVHALMITISAAVLRMVSKRAHHQFSFIADIIWLTLISVWLLFAHGLSIGIWSAVYIHLGIVPDWESALYFAGATYTTLGYGDILAPQEWRILTGATATNGLLLFGLSTAILVDASARLRLGAR